MVSKDIFEIKDNFLKDAGVKSELIYGNRADKPFISIMIPTYERYDYLLKTVESALQQETQIPFEIIVVDNSEQINMKFVEWLKEKKYTKVCYYKNSQNLGMFGNWNRCITLSQGEWVLILNDDDEITPDYIERMGRIVMKKSDIPMLGCTNIAIDENGIPCFQQEESNKIKKCRKS